MKHSKQNIELDLELLSEKLRKFRLKKGFTYFDLFKETGIPIFRLLRFEMQTAIPNCVELLVLALLVGTSPYNFLRVNVEPKRTVKETK